MIREIKKKLRMKRNTKDNQIDTLKEENRRLLKKIDEKNQLIIDLFYIRDEKQQKIDELLEENRALREKKIKK